MISCACLLIRQCVAFLWDLLVFDLPEAIGIPQRLIKEELSDRHIARTLQCCRSKVGELQELPKEIPQQVIPMSVAPDWTHSMEWQSVAKEVSKGFEIKRIWEERVGQKTRYSHF